MVGILLALGSALCYGLSDFGGGLFARRGHFVSIATVGQVSALLLTCVTAPLVSRTVPAPADLGWGGLSGVGSAIGMLFLFRGISRGAMTTVVPVSAVGGTALPVIVGVAIFGERPSVPSWIGILVAIPALWLVSRTRDARGGIAGPAALDGLIAGAGIALQYIALAKVGPDAGIWPVVAGRAAAAAILITVARPVTRAPLSLSPRLAVGAGAAGGAAALALVLYLLSTRQQLVVIAVVLSSLYPVIPVLLGITVLHERLAWRQTLGLVAGGTAVLLIAIG